MGTETPNSSSKSYLNCFKNVKLNNPLMGTETFNLFHRWLITKCGLVKLNNPLMGTETLQYRLLSSLVLLSLN